MIIRPLTKDERALVAYGRTRAPRRHRIIIKGKARDISPALKALQARGLDKLVTRGWRSP